MQKIVFLHIVLFFMRCFYLFIEKLMPKNKRIALFFLTEKVFFDNSKYLFEYMRGKNDFNSILFTSNKKLYKQLQEKFPGEIVYALSLKGFFLFLRSKHVIISYGISAAAFAPYYLHQKCKNIIYLGHGTPMKKMALQTPVWRKYGKRKQLQGYSYMVGSSPLEQIIHAAGFDIDMNNVWVTGLPRNDYLTDQLKLNTDLLLKNPFLDRKIILYAPTWREEGHKTHFFPFEDFDGDKLAKFLEEEDAYILVRGHKEDIKRKSVQKTHDFFAIERVIKADQDRFEDVYELLPYIDILVTDYSSLWIDYLLLDRPIVFLPYDLEEYSQYKGFFIDFEENSPGAKSESQKAFITNLKRYFDQPQTHAKWRKKIRDMYHTYQDNGSCERVYNELRKLNN
ncbi:CDP-glycerol glycerophosphotransferase family protein [Marinifilum sp.]|uniref:CDP-glycerol glycerophosphotransferase family protein n=1 Tax=Marinifilum sp. TaxID=2033137 RepID=UPI003BAA868D